MKESISTELLAVATGTETTVEQAAKMCKDYADQFTGGEFAPSVISKAQIEAILSQPGVAGLAFANGLTADGEKTQVLLGVDAEGNYTENFSVNVDGSLENGAGQIVNVVYSPSPRQWWDK